MGVGVGGGVLGLVLAGVGPHDSLLGPGLFSNPRHAELGTLSSSICAFFTSGARQGESRAAGRHRLAQRTTESERCGWWEQGGAAAPVRKTGSGGSARIHCGSSLAGP